MKLKMIKRAAEKKSETNKLRRDGYIPAIIYGKKTSGENIAIENAEFSAMMRKIPSGRLSTSIFSLADGGKGRRVIIKDIQYNITNYDVIHLDFEELFDDAAVNVKVPIECTGIADCAGIKLGGVLRQVIRQMRVRCLPKDLPDHFELNVKDLNPRQSKKLADLQIPNTVRPLEALNKVVATIVKR